MGRTRESLEADVCVVGAGFAGLAAARRVAAQGRRVVLLEARDRAGGRTWNRTADDGTVLSVGGTWLGVGQDRMFELCREFGLDTYPQYDDGETILRINGSNRRYRGLIPKINPLAVASLGIALKRLDRKARLLPLETPWSSRHADRLDRRSLGEWTRSRRNVPTATARALLEITMTTLFCTDPAEVSLLGALVLARGGGSFEYYADSRFTETHMVEGGVPELATRMAASLGDSLHLSSPVVRISQTNASVLVDADGVAVKASHAIVATPPPLAHRIEYEPALPRPHAQLLAGMTAGSIIRGHALYDEPFWRTDGLSGLSVGLESAVPVALDQTPRSGTPGVLSSYAFGAEAVRLAKMDAKERRSVWLDALAERYGPKAASPVAYLETNWSNEAWSLGGMISHFAPGVLTANGPEALHASAGRIHWAGSERATLMHGLIEGAVRSGERAADEVLR